MSGTWLGAYLNWTKFSETYSAVGAGNLYLLDPSAVKRVGNGIILRRGVRKGVRVIEGEGRPTPALVIDGTCGTAVGY